MQLNKNWGPVTHLDKASSLSTCRAMRVMLIDITLNGKFWTRKNTQGNLGPQGKLTKATRASLGTCLSCSRLYWSLRGNAFFFCYRSLWRETKVMVGYKAASLKGRGFSVSLKDQWNLSSQSVVQNEHKPGSLINQTHACMEWTKVVLPV